MLLSESKMTQPWTAFSEVTISKACNVGSISARISPCYGLLSTLTSSLSSRLRCFPSEASAIVFSCVSQSDLDAEFDAAKINPTTEIVKMAVTMIAIFANDTSSMVSLCYLRMCHTIIVTYRIGCGIG